jgi:hypothetical protein
MATRTKPPEETVEEPTEVPDKATIVDTIKEVLADLGITKPASGTGEEATTETDDDVEEIESPRQQESRMRKTVEAAIGDLHIHVDTKAEAKPEKKETEAVPGKKPLLSRWIGLDA